LKYFRASQISEAAEAIASGAKPLAGGTVLVPNLAANGGRGQTIVDISWIGELAETRIESDSLHLGSPVSLAKIAGSASSHPGILALVQAAAAVGNPQVRRAATIGGNVALGVGTADMVPALLALDASVICYSDGTAQALSLENLDTAGRLITGITIPLREHTHSSFRKLAWRGASGITIVNVAVALSFSNNLISASRVVTGGLGPQVQRLRGAEALLEGQEYTPELGASAAATAAAEAVCQLSGPPSERYRRRVLEYGVREALTMVIAS